MDAFDQEITTIFVIGFPEDMKEREFQNMFTFCQGFEAAILRYPDADAASKEGNTTNKIIGFAKFRTKIEALEARDVLTGRKVDPNSDGVLKAELAKKDLITKRGLFGNKAQSKNVSRSDLHSSFNLNARPLPTNYRLGGLATSAIRPSNLSIITNEGLGRLGGEQPLLSAPLLRSQDLYGDAFNHFDAYTTQTHDSLSSLGNMLNTDYDLGGQDGLSRSISDLKASSSLRLPSRKASKLTPLRTRFSNLNINTRGPATAGAPLTSIGIQPSISSPISLLNASSILAPPQGFAQPSQNYPPPRSAISADANPPCNTLYVGNLSVAATEAELRRLFTVAYGYKRLCFRTKPNSGPMCFVEFRDISCATLALRDYDGRMLPSSTNGGIRLSYSKNPLGVRSNPNVPPTPSTEFFSRTFDDSSSQPDDFSIPSSAIPLHSLSSNVPGGLSSLTALSASVKEMDNSLSDTLSTSPSPEVSAFPIAVSSLSNPNISKFSTSDSYSNSASSSLDNSPSNISKYSMNHNGIIPPTISNDLGLA